jgi:hypothetical protein
LADKEAVSSAELFAEFPLVGAGGAKAGAGHAENEVQYASYKHAQTGPAMTSNGKCAPRYTRGRQTAAARAQGRTFHQLLK